MTALAWLGALPAVFALAMTAVNLRSWPRGRLGARAGGRLSVLVPARNEEQRIEACVRAALASRHPVDEVIVYDDQSSDATRAVLARIDDARVRVIEGGPLPVGWIGKPHACHRLAAAATGEVLLFVDADTVLEPEGIERLVSLLDRETAIVSAVPRQRMVSFGERLIVPLLHLTYTSWLPLALVPNTTDPRVTAANGQLLAMRAAALRRLGGFAAVAAEIVDDVALCRRAKERGARVVFADGHAMAHCRMYCSAREVIEGFSKNLHEGIGTTAGLAFAAALYALAFVAPYAALAWSFWPAVVAVAANVSLRTLLVWRFRQPLEGIVLHPLSVVALIGIAANSWRWTKRGALRWSGRMYAPRAQREESSR